MTDARTVMIVEDEPKLARLIADYLAAANLASQWIADGMQVEPAVRAAPARLLDADHGSGGRGRRSEGPSDPWPRAAARLGSFREASVTRPPLPSKP